MSDKKRDFNEKRITDGKPSKRGEPVPGTGQEIKRHQQKGG